MTNKVDLFAAVVLLSVATLFAPNWAQAAATLFSNPLALDGGLYSEPAQIIADSFSIAGGGSVNEVSWYGNAYNGLPFGPFSVTFYQDSGSKPGAILATNPVAPTIVDTGLSNSFFGGQNVRDTYQFTATIPTFDAAPGVSYFFSVESTSESTFLGNFVWANSSATPQSVGSFDGGTSWSNAPSSVAFRLLSTPALPVAQAPGGAFIFDLPVVGGIPIFIDPSVAVGYDYAVSAGDPLFASVTLPFGIGDNQYALSVGGQSFSVAAGTWFDFLSYFPGGVDAFTVSGIDPSAMLDPTDGQAFVTGLTFVGGGTFSGTMTPLTVNVPEPPTPLLLALAWLVFMVGPRSPRNRR